MGLPITLWGEAACIINVDELFVCQLKKFVKKPTRFCSGITNHMITLSFTFSLGT